MNFKNGIKNTSKQFKIMFFLKIITALLLCRLHDFTRYKVCRSFSDLFYWPEGLCVDMLVIYAFFLILALIVGDYVSFFSKCGMQDKANMVMMEKD